MGTLKGTCTKTAPIAVKARIICRMSYLDLTYTCSIRKFIKQKEREGGKQEISDGIIINGRINRRLIL
jgi:hypothetical protein